VVLEFMTLSANDGHRVVMTAREAPIDPAEAAVAAGARTLHGLIEHATDGILLADEQGNLIEWNRAEERLTGLDREAVLGRPVWEVLYELLPADERTQANRKRIHEFLRHAVNTGDLRGTGGLTERHVWLPDGSDRWVHSLNFTIPTGRGHVLGRISRDITDRKLAEAELLRRNRQLEILSETSQQINAVLDTTVVLRTLVLAATEALGAVGGAAGLVEGDLLRFSEARVRGDACPVTWSYARGEGPAGMAWRTLQPVVWAGAQADPGAPDGLGELLGAYDLVSVPLVGRDGRVLGCLEVYGAAERPAGADGDAALGLGSVQALALLRGLAAGAATALENTYLLAERERAYARAEQGLRRMTALRAVDSAINASLSLGVTLQVVLEHAQEHLGLDAATVLTANAVRQTLEFAAGRGFQTQGVERNPLRYGEGLAGRAVLDRRLVQAGDLAGAETYVRRGARLADLGFAAYYAMPLLAKGEVKGVLELFGREPLAADPEWREFLETLAGQAALAIDGAQLFNDLQRANFDLSLAYDATIEGWARALDLRERQPAGQSQRLAQSAERLGRALGLPAADLVALRRGALLHDIGHVAIPDEILYKPGPLTADEWDVMHQHPEHAQAVLSPIAFLRAAVEVPYGHHERWDGSGYPRALQGEAIPLAARIFAVADVWDALRSVRPYRPAWPAARARAYLAEQAGTLFDPRVVDVFMALN
jgi:PAS domain S-box-containing protein